MNEMVERAQVKGPYRQTSIRARIEAFLLDNVGKVITREQLIEVARDPGTGIEPENWHQRLSELRTDSGYTILSSRDRKILGSGEYMLASAEKKTTAGKRKFIDAKTWKKVVEEAGYRCQWVDGGVRCTLHEGDTDPVGGGTVHLTPDHKTPHEVNPEIDSNDPNKWQALCGRHQVTKKNYWDHTTGRLNVYAIVQSATETEKRRVYKFLKEYFGE